MSSPDFRLYPNPSSDHVRLDLGSVREKDLRLSVYSISGQQVLDTRTTGNTDIDVSGWEKGTYIFSVYNDNIRTQLKFVRE